MLAIALLAPAGAAPTGSLHAWGALGQHGADQLAGGGVGGAFGLPLGEVLHLDLGGEAGVAGDLAPWLAARPELRLFLAPRTAPAPTLSVSAGAGVRWSQALHPDLAVGAALDLPGRGALVPRLQARYLVDPTGDGSTLLMTAGVTWRRPTPAPPRPDPGPPPPDRWTWVPHPVSACVLDSQVQSRLAAARLAPEAGQPPPDPEPAPPEPPLAPTGPSPTAAVVLPTPLDLADLLHPSQGSLVVASEPGDQVQVGELVLPQGPDWTVVTTVPEGPVEVVIRGAGRRQELSPAIAAGYAVWLRSRTDSSPHLVTFAQGSAELSGAHSQALAALVENAGSYAFRLQGSYSPEGTRELNAQLAQQRAVVVRDALLAAGMPPERLELMPIPERTDPRGDPARQRSCVITPVAPAGGPQ